MNEVNLCSLARTLKSMGKEGNPQMRCLAKTAAVCVCVLAGLALVVVIMGNLSLPPITPLDALDPQMRSLAQYQGRTINVVPFVDFPKSYRDAYVAAEDPCLGQVGIIVYAKGVWKGLSQNPGPLGECRASSTNFRVANGLLPGHERSVEHGLKEIAESLRLGHRYSGDAILTIYGNSAYFGDNMFGISDASQHYFKKDVHELSLDEVACLLAIMRSPSFAHHPELLKRKRDSVIDAMVQKHLLQSPEAEEAKARPLPSI